jgi:hypothetical protein
MFIAGNCKYIHHLKFNMQSSSLSHVSKNGDLMKLKEPGNG